MVTFPVAVVLGFIGYNVETVVSSRQTPYLDHSIDEEREIRLINEKELKEQRSKTIFDKNDPAKLR